MTTLAHARLGSTYAPAPRLSLRAIALIVAAHGGLLALLVSLDVVPLPPVVSTLVVDLIQPAAPKPPPEIVKPQPRPVEVKPQPRRQPTPTPQPILAAPVESAAPAVEVPQARTPPPPPAPPTPVTVSQPRFDADYLSNPAPAYPPLSRRLGEEGKVVLRVHVEPAGHPSQVELKTSSGSPRLDQAAQDAVRRWQFIPAKRGDEAVAAWVLVPIVFNLKN
ncbi:MAG: energy transducer TonB [Rhodocyclales bacterium]|nr:energy transducer TonB [Rhodocyclales bacterium]